MTAPNVVVTYPGGWFALSDTPAGVRVRQFRRAGWSDAIGPGRKTAVARMVAEEVVDRPLHVVLDAVHDVAAAVRRGEYAQEAT